MHPLVDSGRDWRTDVGGGTRRLAQRRQRQGRHAVLTADADRPVERFEAARGVGLSHAATPARGRRSSVRPSSMDGVMYVTTVRTRVVALDAATGEERWTYDPYTGPAPRAGGTARPGGVNRGVAYWSDGSGRPAASSSACPTAACSASMRRPASPTQPSATAASSTSARVTPTSATCRSCPTGRRPHRRSSRTSSTSGARTARGTVAAPGDVRAFDVRTGKEVWRFHTIPRPGEPLAETWEATPGSDRGGANPWGGFTVDVENGILFCATGSAGPDFYGGDRQGRQPLRQLRARARRADRQAPLALPDRCGTTCGTTTTPARQWSARSRSDGRDVPVVAQVTKTGYCFLFERKTGRPLFGVGTSRRRPPTCRARSPARRSPSRSSRRRSPAQAIDEDDVTDLSPEARAAVLEQLKKLRHDGPAAPPSERGTVVTPRLPRRGDVVRRQLRPALGRALRQLQRRPVRRHAASE